MSTLEVLELVNTVELEILLIVELIRVQCSKALEVHLTIALRLLSCHVLIHLSFFVLQDIDSPPKSSAIGPTELR